MTGLGTLSIVVWAGLMLIFGRMVLLWSRKTKVIGPDET